MSASGAGLAVHESLGISDHANAFATPLEILPEWYLFPIFNLLRILSDKCIGILSILALASLFLKLPIAENLNKHQNPFHRPIMLALFLALLLSSIWLSLGPLAAISEALPLAAVL
jgi:cytochrome b6-f complex subunit 4